MAEIIDFEEAKKVSFKQKAKEKLKALKEKASVFKKMVISWANDNPEEAAQALIGLGGLCISGGGILYHHVSKKTKEKMEKDASEREQYDPRTGMYFYTKRPMTNAEKLELSRRMKQGEYKADILDSFGLL